MAIETLLVTSTSQECGLQNDTDIWMVKNGNCNFTLLLTSSGQERQFHIATDIYW